MSAVYRVQRVPDGLAPIPRPAGVAKCPVSGGGVGGEAAVFSAWPPSVAK